MEKSNTSLRFKGLTEPQRNGNCAQAVTRRQGLRLRAVALIAATISILMLANTLLTGCANTSDSQSQSSSGAATPSSQALTKLVVGSLATEDILPLWVAQEEGMFEEAGLEVDIQIFQSAQELSTAMVSGAVDMAMTDIMVSATLEASGSSVSLEWVTLGATPEQGRFGIMTSPDSGITSLEDLAGVPIGVGSCTVPEYVMDKLMEQAGIPEDQIVGEEIKKVPVRYEMMSSNQVAAAALPGSFLALGETNGNILLADDTAGKNYSQSVMVAQASLSDSDEGAVSIKEFASVWGAAAEKINNDPEEFRFLLVEKAQLPEQVKDTYPISTYPMAERPSADMVDPVLDWMHKKGYLSEELSYDSTSGRFNH